MEGKTDWKQINIPESNCRELAEVRKKFKEDIQSSNTVWIYCDKLYSNFKKQGREMMEQLHMRMIIMSVKCQYILRHLNPFFEVFELKKWG